MGIEESVSHHPEDEMTRRKKALDQLLKLKAYLQSPSSDIDEFSSRSIAYLCWFTKIAVFTASDLEKGFQDCLQQYIDAGGKNSIS